MVMVVSEKENIETKKLIDITETHIKRYGTATIEQRAVPDYRDGFKPVHRRIMWSAFNDIKMGSGGRYFKSARLVGDVLGKYHPHGDAAVYDALVNMVNLPVSQFEKTGNFGTVNDTNYAAQRYTEVRFSKYGEKTFFNSFLEQIVPMLPNYDGQYKEPLYLPCLYPNLLLNGISGIAVGVTCDIPPLHIDTLMPFIEKAINGEDISVSALVKKLRFNWKYGSHCVSSNEEIATWIKYGSGNLWFEPEYEIDSAKRTIVVTEAAPNFDFAKVVEALLGEERKKKNSKGPAKRKFEYVSSAEDECKYDKKTQSEVVRFVVKLKNNIDPDEFSNHAKAVIAEFTKYKKTATNVTFRKTDDIKFLSGLSMPDLITRWAKYRVGLEKKILRCKIEKLEKGIVSKDLMLLAIDNRKIIKDSMEVSHPYEYIEEKLKITNEQARTVLGWSVISLAKVSREKVLGDKQGLIVEKRGEQKLLANPKPKVLSDMSSGLKLIN